MLYIVSGELIPESNKLYSGRLTAIGNIFGFILGMIALNFTQWHKKRVLKKSFQYPFKIYGVLYIFK